MVTKQDEHIGLFDEDLRDAAYTSTDNHPGALPGLPVTLSESWSTDGHRRKSH